MKRNAIRLIILVLFWIVIVYVNTPEYKIFSSYSFEGKTYKETYLNVVVYKYSNLDKTISNIQKLHFKMNGFTNELHISLYYSKYDIIHNKKPFKKISFINGEKASP